MTRDARETFYDGIADSFDEVMDRYDLERRLWVVFDALLGDVPLEGRRLLDAGCGTGHFSARAAARGARVVSLDLGPRLVARAPAARGSPRTRRAWASPAAASTWSSRPR